MNPSTVRPVWRMIARSAKAFPLAENDEFSEEISSDDCGRSRVSFTIKGRQVHVLHVRGSYLGSD
jgi:hypothetical protein